MKSFILFLALIITSPAFCQSAQGMIRGTINDVNGQPVDSCTVTLLGANTEEVKVIMKENGKFLIQPIWPGTYVLEISKNDYTPIQIKDVIVNADRITFYDDLIIFKPDDDPKPHKKIRRKK